MNQPNKPSSTTIDEPSLTKPPLISNDEPPLGDRQPQRLTSVQIGHSQ